MLKIFPKVFPLEIFLEIEKRLRDETERVLEDVKKGNMKFINLQFTDMLGAIKSVTIPIEHVKCKEIAKHENTT